MLLAHPSAGIVHDGVARIYLKAMRTNWTIRRLIERCDMRNCTYVSLF